MSRLTSIRWAIRNALATDDTNAPGFQVSAGRTVYEEGAGLDQQDFAVTVSAGSPSPAAEELLDEMLDSSGPRSVKALLEADRTLGGLVVDLRVASTTGVVAFPHTEDEPAEIGVTWTVQTRMEGDL